MEAIPGQKPGAKGPWCEWLDLEVSPFKWKPFEAFWKDSWAIWAVSWIQGSRKGHQQFSEGPMLTACMYKNDACQFGWHHLKENYVCARVWHNLQRGASADVTVPSPTSWLYNFWKPTSLTYMFPFAGVFEVTHVFLGCPNTGTHDTSVELLKTWTVDSMNENNCTQAKHLICSGESFFIAITYLDLVMSPI